MLDGADMVLVRVGHDQRVDAPDNPLQGLRIGNVGIETGEIGRPAKVIVTGGLALLFDEHTEIFDAVDTDLTLTGLAILAERAAAR